MVTDLNQTPQPLTVLNAAPAQVRDGAPTAELGSHAAIVSWVMSFVSDWRQQRDTAYLKAWDSYYRLWRGQWDGSDSLRKSERSKMIAPALAEAIDLTHAEITEAVFGRGHWFDVDEDLGDKQPEADQVHAQLDQDMNDAGVPEAVGKALQIGTLYGTGIAKISMEEEEYITLNAESAEPVYGTRLIAKVYPIDVREFVPDPSTDSIEDMLGCAHETVWPAHMVTEKQRNSYFFKADLGDTATAPYSTMQPGAQPNSRGTTFITEWHGKVPAKLMTALKAGGNENPHVEDTDEMIECIVTIANESTLLRAVVNPVWGQDRAIVAYQHETLPTEFWGRGVAEKGFNSQKALDATFRMRLDAGALVAAPQIGVDKTRLPRGFSYRVSPGKEWPTTGNPSEILFPFNLGNTNPQIFQDTEALSAMVKQATGAFDPGTALSQGSRRDTMGGTAMMAASTVKRSRRTMLNIENQFLQPLLNKIIWRYVQFCGDRYPADYKFVVKGAMGIMAREYEQSYLSSILQTIPPEDKRVRDLILKEIIANSSSANKEALESEFDQMLSPPDEETQRKQQYIESLQLRKLEAEVNEMEAKAANQAAQAGEHAAKADGLVIDASLKGGELQLEAVDLSIRNKEADAYTQQVQQSAADAQVGHRFKAIELMQKEEKLAIDKKKANKPSSK